MCPAAPAAQVSVAAAVEDALASLLVEGALDAPLRARAALTWVRRLYHPFLIRQPALHALQLPDLCACPMSPGQSAAGGKIGPVLIMDSKSGNQCLLLAWLYDAPVSFGMPFSVSVSV